jgi:hypothetical protein
MVPASAFNSQVDADQIWRDSFVTRLYGGYNQRGPFLYPESPYALSGLGDIVSMAAMQPVDADTLFTTLPSASEIATSTAPIGSAGYPTFRATAPTTPGTALGPAGATVPSAGVNSNAASGNPSVPSNAGGEAAAQIQQSYTSPYGAPATTLDQAMTTGGNVGPSTFENPWPSIIQPPPSQQPAPAPSLLCQFGQWVNRNPALAALGTYGVYLLLKKKGARK